MKSYKYKLRPSKTLANKFEDSLNTCRELYNAAIEERNKAYKAGHRSINYYTQSRQLPEIRVIRPDVGTAYAQVLQDVLRRVARAFDAFFQRCLKGETPGYPRFKGKNRYNSFTYPQEGYKLNGSSLYLSKIGTCRLFLSRPIKGKIKTCTIKREADGWYVVFAVEENECPFIPRTGDNVGIDLGIENFATLSTGEVIENPQYLRVAEQRLKTAQRSVTRKKKQSRNRKKAIKLFAKQHQKITRQRRDFCFKTAHQLTKEFDEFAVEDLNIKGMVLNHSLAKSIGDASWGTFIEILTFKAESAGRTVWKVTPHYTSQDCSRCGNRVKKSLATREHRCSVCGLVLHRDHNAAINILSKSGVTACVDTAVVNAVNEARTV